MRSAWTVILIGSALLACAGCPTAPAFEEGPPRVEISTNRGDFTVELAPDNAPRSVANFRQYVQDGFYDGTIFHRVVPGFVVQGGGYLPDLQLKATRGPIAHESSGGLRNVRGSVGLARADDPNSATSQFYVNLVDNGSLDPTLTFPGYTVLGQVVAGMDVIDTIATVPTATQDSFADVPVDPVVILHAVEQPGERTLSAEWDNYLVGLRYNLASALRDVLVGILGNAIIYD